MGIKKLNSQILTIFKFLIVLTAIDCMVGFRRWLRHLKIIELNKLLMVTLCNKAFYNVKAIILPQQDRNDANEQRF
ncbi:hypothetical protein B9T25_00285 [Acinetobacter sp. ANC 4470]|nr:hypothetical protein B9T25_00285 [Acinetobacter sp. ANC 4470]